MSAEMLFGHGFHAIDAIAHFDAVQVDFHDALLAPHELNEHGEIRLESLAQPRTSGP